MIEKLRSKIAQVAARLIKVAMGAVVIPLAVSLVGSLRDHLLVDSASGETALQWMDWGFMTYLGVHVLLYRPVRLFRMTHWWFAMIAAWLFGGQVGSMERPGAKGKGSKASAEAGGAEGSTLVAFSPYAMPFSVVLVCFLGWFAGRWIDRTYMDGLSGFLVGAALAFHWIMTADELQQQRKRWHIETYLLAIGLIFVVTVFIAALCLPLVVAEFSFFQWLADAAHRTQVIYSTAFEKLFGV